jgi:hypothetical protein
MPRCTGSKPDSTPCERIVGASQTYCYAHDPARASERKRNSSKAGRSRPSREIEALKRRLEELANDVLAGRVERGDAAVVNQILNTRARLIELERKIREQEEVLERIEALEEMQDKKSGGKRWGV